MSISPELPPVLWVGGGSGAGKTTVSRAVAHRADLAWYRIDAHAYEHHARLVARRLVSEDHRTYDQRWLQPTAAELAEEFASISAKLMPLIIEDLSDMHAGVGVVVEGPQLLPDLVAPHLTDPAQAVWLIPTGTFRQEALRRRAGGVHNQTSDPAAALERLLQRNRLLDDRIRTQAASLGGMTIDVDGSRDLPTMISHVHDRFFPLLEAMPKFSAGRQRQQTRKQENDAMVRNVLAFFAELNADRAPGPLPFACECDTLGCDALVECTPADHRTARADGTPITAHAAPEHNS